MAGAALPFRHGRRQNPLSSPWTGGQLGTTRHARRRTKCTKCAHLYAHDVHVGAIQAGIGKPFLAGSQGVAGSNTVVPTGVFTGRRPFPPNDGGGLFSSVVVTLAVGVFGLLMSFHAARP